MARRSRLLCVFSGRRYRAVLLLHGVLCTVGPERIAPGTDCGWRPEPSFGGLGAEPLRKKREGRGLWREGTPQDKAEGLGGGPGEHKNLCAGQRPCSVAPRAGLLQWRLYRLKTLNFRPAWPVGEANRGWPEILPDLLGPVHRKICVQNKPPDVMSAPSPSPDHFFTPKHVP